MKRQKSRFTKVVIFMSAIISVSCTECRHRDFFNEIGSNKIFFNNEYYWQIDSVSCFKVDKNIMYKTKFNLPNFYFNGYSYVNDGYWCFFSPHQETKNIECYFDLEQSEDHILTNGTVIKSGDILGDTRVYRVFEPIAISDDQKISTMNAWTISLGNGLVGYASYNGDSLTSNISIDNILN